MKTWPKLAVIVLVIAGASIGIAFIPRQPTKLVEALPPSQYNAFIHSSFLQVAVTMQPPRALRACRASSRMTQAEFLRVAVCLHRKHLLSTKIVSEIKNDKGFATIGSGVGGESSDSSP